MSYQSQLDRYLASNDYDQGLGRRRASLSSQKTAFSKGTGSANTSTAFDPGTPVSASASPARVVDRNTVAFQRTVQAHRASRDYADRSPSTAKLAFGSRLADISDIEVNRSVTSLRGGDQSRSAYPPRPGNLSGSSSSTAANAGNASSAPNASNASGASNAVNASAISPKTGLRMAYKKEIKNEKNMSQSQLFPTASEPVPEDADAFMARILSDQRVRLAHLKQSCKLICAEGEMDSDLLLSQDRVDYMDGRDWKNKFGEVMDHYFSGRGEHVPWYHPTAMGTSSAIRRSPPVYVSHEDPLPVHPDHELIHIPGHAHRHHKESAVAKAYFASLSSQADYDVNKFFVAARAPSPADFDADYRHVTVHTEHALVHSPGHEQRRHSAMSNSAVSKHYI